MRIVWENAQGCELAAIEVREGYSEIQALVDLLRDGGELTPGDVIRVFDHDRTVYRGPRG